MSTSSASSTSRGWSRRPTPCRSSTSCVTTRSRRACPRRRPSPTRPTATASSSGCRGSSRIDGSVTSDLARLTMHELTAAYCRRETRPSEATEAYIARIDRLDGKVGAYLRVTRDRALAAARAADARYERGTPLSPLDGVPIAYKDVLCTRGVTTTCGSKVLEGFVPPYDATAVARLTEAGAVMLGKTNMDEFAVCSSTEHSALKPTHNP